MHLGGILSISEVNALTSEQFEWLFKNHEIMLLNITQNIAQYVAHLHQLKILKDIFMNI